MMFWVLVCALGAAWLAQSYLSFRQAKAFSTLFVHLRRKGRVAMGKFRGGIVSGSIVMFVLDDDNRIVEGRRMAGVTVLARFKRFDAFDSCDMADVDPACAARFGRPTMKAVANAVDTFRILTAGGEAPEPPTAFARVLARLPGPRPKARHLAQPVVATVRSARPRRVCRAAPVSPPATLRRRSAEG